MRKLIGIRNARLFLLGDLVSTLGDSALWLAMAIWIKELTGSSAAAGLVFFCFAVGSLASPLGGALADRFRRRPLLICANLAGAAVVLLILLVHDRSQVWLIYLVIFLYGLVGSVISPAQTALLPALVPADLLAEANGARQTLNEGLRLVIPLIGAGLFALVGAAVVAEIDAATFLVAVVTLLALRVQEERPERASEAPGQGGQLTAAFRFIRADSMLRPITVALALSMLVFGFTESALFSVVTTGLHHSASFVGVLMTAQGAGSVGGGLTAAVLLRRMSEGMTTALALALCAVAVLLVTLSSVVAVLAAMVVAGFVIPWVVVAATTAIQRRTPTAMLGRVFGAFELTLTLPQVLSIGLGAALIATVNYRTLLAVIAVVVTVSALYLVSQRAVRTSPPRPAAAGESTAEAAAAGVGTAEVSP